MHTIEKQQASVTEGDLLTPKEVANLLRIGRSALYEWLAFGKLPYYKLGRAIRIHRKDVENFLRAGRR